MVGVDQERVPLEQNGKIGKVFFAGHPSDRKLLFVKESIEGDGKR
jgi:hypothetical protein